MLRNARWLELILELIVQNYSCRPESQALETATLALMDEQQRLSSTPQCIMFVSQQQQQQQQQQDGTC